MRLHILGICGTFMGGIAMLARELGHQVSGSDANVYPPMSTLLHDSGIPVHEGYDTGPLMDAPDRVIIGNTLSRGNEAVEFVLDRRLPYTSGPQWLSDNVLRGRYVFAIAGTHGKTSTTSMLAWVLEQAGLSPGFLIGGVAENFNQSARLGTSEYFVVEADEYDTAFFDKRSKFIHYQPQTLVINNIEYDHADIFADISDITREFRRLVRIIPRSGNIVIQSEDPNIPAVFEEGCWSNRVSFGGEGGDWRYLKEIDDFSRFNVVFNDEKLARVNWDLIGRHNAENALAVMAAAHCIGISPDTVAGALSSYKSVKRRLQKLAVIRGITVYDDFAHHPTAISATLSALRAKVGEERIIAVFEPRSNTMKMGVHKDTLAPAFSEADRVVVYRPEGLNWDLEASMQGPGERIRVYDEIAIMVDSLVQQLMPGDHVLIMSNGGFGGFHGKLITRLSEAE